MQRRHREVPSLFRGSQLRWHRQGAARRPGLRSCARKAHGLDFCGQARLRGAWIAARGVAVPQRTVPRGPQPSDFAGYDERPGWDWFVGIRPHPFAGANADAPLGCAVAPAGIRSIAPRYFTSVAGMRDLDRGSVRAVQVAVPPMQQPHCDPINPDRMTARSEALPYEAEAMTSEKAPPGVPALLDLLDRSNRRASVSPPAAPVDYDGGAT